MACRTLLYCVQSGNLLCRLLGRGVSMSDLELRETLQAAGYSHAVAWLAGYLKSSQTGLLLTQGLSVEEELLELFLLRL